MESNQINIIKIPYIVHEAEIYRSEKRAQRWQAAFFVTLAMLFLTVLGWAISTI